MASAILLCGLAPFSRAAMLPRSISSSRQFIVYGQDAALRGAVCDLAERTKTAALTLLGEKDAWSTPIVVHAHYPEANLPELPAARLNFSQTGSGLRLQLDLSIAPDGNAPSVQRQLLRAIYLEMMYREQPDVPAGTAYAEPPDWLLDGTLALAGDHDGAQATELLQPIAQSGGVVSLADFLRQRPALLEAPLQTLYRAYSVALVSLLSESAEDRAHLARFVADLFRSAGDPLAELQKHFPRLGENREVIEKNWTDGAARLSAMARFHLLDCAETEQQLAETLRVEGGGRGTPIYSIEEFPRFVTLSESPAAMKKLTHDLVVLSGRANPLFLPVILEYEKIAVQLARRKTKHIPERLAEARSQREQISRTMRGIEDYMNWFEATQARTASGAFRDYLKAAELTLEQTPRRRDRISIYLDATEALIQN